MSGYSIVDGNSSTTKYCSWEADCCALHTRICEKGRCFLGGPVYLSTSSREAFSLEHAYSIVPLLLDCIHYDTAGTTIVL